MDAFSVVSFVNAIKSSLDVINASLRIKEDRAVQRAVTEINEKTYLLSQRLTALSAEAETLYRAKTDLEKELVALKKVIVDLERYALQALPTGAFVYALRESFQGTEPAHALCPNCYNQQIKSVLQFAGYESVHKTLRCPRCGTVILSERVSSGPVPQLPRRERGF